MHVAFRVFLFLWLTMLVALPANAGERRYLGPVGTIEKPIDKDWGDIYLVEIELPRAKPHPTEYYCPIDEEADDQSICISASVIYRAGVVLRVLASSTGESLPDMKVRVKHLGPHAVRFAEAVHTVMLLERTDNGYFWAPITANIRRSKFCISDDAMEYFSIDLDLRPRKSSDGESCFRIGR